MGLKGSHILSTRQFSKEQILDLFEEAKNMERILETGKSDLLSDKLMATIFFEPSTRTRFSFETAMNRLGGRVISNFDMMKTSSIKKRETLNDTGKIISQFADVIVMRHPGSGSVEELAKGSDVPVINAGDGPNDHPTQGLLDLYTIWREKGTLDGITVGMIGDLKYGRVVHSQAYLLGHFDVNFIFVSPEELKMPEVIVANLNNPSIRQTVDFEAAISEMDVISMTRIQEERFETASEYQKYAGLYILNAEMMRKAKKDSIIIHPLPRVDEITDEVDADPRAKYFEQVKNGVAVRMALLKKVLKG